MRIFAVLLINFSLLVVTQPTFAQNKPTPGETTTGAPSQADEAARNRATKRKVCEGLINTADSVANAYRNLSCMGRTGPAMQRCSLEKSGLHKTYINIYDNYLGMGCASLGGLSFPRA